jgi:hypothetical protein
MEDGMCRFFGCFKCTAGTTNTDLFLLDKGDLCSVCQTRQEAQILTQKLRRYRRGVTTILFLSAFSLLVSVILQRVFPSFSRVVFSYTVMFVGVLTVMYGCFVMWAQQELCSGLLIRDFPLEVFETEDD